MNFVDFEQRVLSLTKSSVLTSCSSCCPCCLMVEVRNIASFIIKINKNKIIVHNKELVCSSLLNGNIQHSIIFNNYYDFLQIIYYDENDNKKEKVYKLINDMRKKDVVEVTGDVQVLSTVLSLMKNPLTFNNTGSKPSSSPGRVFQGTKDHINNNKKEINIIKKNKCFQSGWLYKKRDVLSGWTYRFFKLYSGQLEYFVDEVTTTPRGVIPLLGAHIVGYDENDIAERIIVNGNQGHYRVM